MLSSNSDQYLFAKMSEATAGKQTEAFTNTLTGGNDLNDPQVAVIF